MVKPNLTRSESKSVQAITISEIIDETPNIKTFMFDKPLQANPGQFVMVWLPGVDEIPMSVSYTGARPGITVARVGPTTIKMHELSVGNMLGIRGPYGHGFDLDGANNILAVAGGCGSAPIGPVLNLVGDNRFDMTFLVGARTGAELLFKSRAERLDIKTEVCTDDGSEGYHGFVTERLAEIIAGNKFDRVITCGPEVMLKKVVELALRNNIQVQASLERYMKCGVGICDSCAINGYQVCRDGPVFSGEILANLSEFGTSRRDACGRAIDV